MTASRFEQSIRPQPQPFSATPRLDEARGGRRDATLNGWKEKGHRSQGEKRFIDPANRADLNSFREPGQVRILLTLQSGKIPTSTFRYQSPSSEELACNPLERQGCNRHNNCQAPAIPAEVKPVRNAPAVSATAGAIVSAHITPASLQRPMTDSIDFARA